MKALRVILIWLFVAFLWVVCITKGCAQGLPLFRVKHDAFTSYYDQQLKNPVFVYYVLQYPHFSGSNKVSGRHFKADTQLPRPRILDKDFSGSGYVRGHLCSAGDRDSDKSWLKETYLTSNLVPMTMYCNSGPWKVIEDSCRTLAKAGHNLVLARGPLYYDLARPDAKVIRARYAIQVPDGFFCLAKCQDCSLHVCLWCLNVGTNERPTVLHFERDERVSLILHNVLGAWSREEYEIITR